MIVETVNPIWELVMPKGTQTNERNWIVEIEAQPVIAEARISKCWA